MTSGVYFILNLVNGKHYVGSSVDIATRWKAHRSILKRKVHHSIKLQRAWDKHGEGSFRLDIIELVSPEVLIGREQFWIDSTRPFYNILRTASSVQGYRHTLATKAKMRAAKVGGTLSEEHKRKISLAGKGRVISAEHRRKLSQRIVSQEARLAVSRAQTGKVPSAATRLKLSANRKGKKFTEEQKLTLKAAKAKLTNEQKENIKKVTVQTHAKFYVVTSPEGVEQKVFNISEFSRQNGLGNGAGMSRVARGTRPHHKGWKCMPFMEAA